MIRKIVKLDKKLLLLFVAFFSNLVVYLAFFKDINVVCRYLDGPLYLEVAKSLYNGITSHNPAGLPEWYFSVHLIGFPAFIRVFSNFVSDCSAMLATTTLFAGLSVVLFYLLLKQGKYVQEPFWLSLVFIFFSPRWWLYHAAPASEPLFLTLVFACLLFFQRKKYLLSVLMAAFAAITRIFGLLMFPLLFYLFYKKGKLKEMLASLLIPGTLFLHFSYYYFRFGDFFAYFKWNAKQIKAIPFITQIFLRINDDKTAVAEFFILLCLITIIGIWRLRKHPLIFWYSLLFFIPIPFLIQVDFSRFFIPIFPFVWLVSFEKFFSSKVFKVIFIPLLIISCFYVITTIPTNLFPAGSFQDLIKGIL